MKLNVLKFKISQIFIVNILCSNLIFCEGPLHFQYDSDIKILSRVFHDIVDEFILKENIQFNIFNVKIKSELILDIISEFLAETNERFKYRIKSLQHGWINYLASSFIFLESLEDFSVLEKLSIVKRMNHQPVKYFVFILDSTFKQLKNSNVYNFYRVIPYFEGSIFQYSYFITNEAETVTLSTVEWFSPYGCNRQYLLKLNRFVKKSQKWKTKLENYEKFLNYHKCELVMFLPVPLPDGLIAHTSGFSIPINNLTNFIIYGITPEIFKIAAQVNNFTVAFQPGRMDLNYFSKGDQDFSPKYVDINGTHKDAQVFFELSILISSFKDLCSSNVAKNFHFLMLVTPAEKYTPPKFNVINSEQFTDAYLTQSDNSTAKIALVIDEILKSRYDFYENKDNFVWNELDEVLFTSFDAFLFHCNSFYFRMINKIINNLIPTGLLNYLINNHYIKSPVVKTNENKPKVLSINDLNVGFNIWLLCCLLSFFTFIAEFIVRFIIIRVNKKQKIHPEYDPIEIEMKCNLKSELIENFRIKTNRRE
ncbi:unnamed protein product [Chironomus riparius]|uniref:Uncharacterized protein n=1 Tax=Chironomus riparius TaxID=315576 RepID=A0A9N9WWX2_9DIPT|nr:unnamed protein product [Chironomus riparius]